MRLVEWARNQIESSRLLNAIHDCIGRNSLYRKTVFRKVQKRIEYVSQSKTYSLMLEVSSACNARCVFCPNQSMKRKKQVMASETFELIIQRILEDGIKPPVLDLFDVGEPLLDGSLFDRARRLKATFPYSSIRITTNFALATDSIIEEVLDSGIDSVHISLNAATEESYKKIMGLEYVKTVSNINRLIERRRALGSKLNILLSMVMCPENINEKNAFVKQWTGKVDSIRLQRAVDWGGAVELRSSYSKKKQLYPCSDLFDRIVILSNGDIAFCCQDSEGGTGMNVKDVGILQAFYSETFENMRQKHLGNGIASIRMCNNCFAVNSNGSNWLFANHS